MTRWLLRNVESRVRAMSAENDYFKQIPMEIITINQRSWDFVIDYGVIVSLGYFFVKYYDLCRRWVRQVERGKRCIEPNLL